MLPEIVSFEDRQMYDKKVDSHAAKRKMARGIADFPMDCK